MSNFLNDTVHFGEIKPNGQVTISFTKSPNADPIVRIVPQCGCTGAVDLGDRVQVTYVAASQNQTYTSSKRVAVTFQRADNTTYEENLILTGQVVAK